MSTSIPTPSNNTTSNVNKNMPIQCRPRSRPRPRPRQLLDLPDEILCLILAYCSQDLDFLLWSCPLITAEDQFCHDCYHCSLCHGPLHPTKQPGNTTSASQNTRRSNRLRGGISSSNANRFSDYINSNKSNTGGGNSNSNRVTESGNGNSSSSDSIVRKRRRRLAAAEEREDHHRIIAHDRAFTFLGLVLGRKSSQKCPHNVQRQSSDHPGPHQRHLSSSLHHQHSSSFWSRHLPRRTTSLHHHSPLPPIQLILPPTTSDSFASAAFSFISRRAQNQGQRLIERSGGLKATVIPGGSSANAEDNPLPDMKPLTRTSRHHAFIRAQSWDQGTGHYKSLAQEQQSMHTVVSHASRRRARSMTLTLNVTLEGNASFPSQNYMAGFIPSAAGAPQIASPPPNDNAKTTETRVEQGSKTGSNSSMGEQVDDEYTDTIELSAPFQLLLVSRRFADIAVRSLWKGIVFHGHDSFQVQALLSTLRNDESASSGDSSVVSQTDINSLGLDLVKDSTALKPTPTLLSVHDDNEPTKARSNLIDSVQQSVKRFNGFRQPTQTTAAPSKGLQQLYAVNSQTPLLPVQDRSGPLRRHSTTGVESAPMKSRSPTSQPQSPTTNLPPSVRTPRWSYRQLPRNIVLNFSHPQASPHLLVTVLECIRSHCRDQVRALDLRANEKMQAAGLETPSELERLFGSGFSRLQYLRLQGGFVDNQLLSAVTKGIISATNSPSSSPEGTSQERRRLQQQQTEPSLPLQVTPSCQLSQVFLGPGSVTDSAIAKLIVAASHCLEVFTVTSCVDVGGGALASLLTECPKLRVLAVHKSLARDIELLEGLGFDSDSFSSLNSPLGAVLPDILPSPSRKRIIAPLERLELGTVQLTSMGIAEILRGVSQTLRFLVLEPRHFKETLLRDVIVPKCRKLELLHFDDPDHYYQHQLRQYRMQRRQHQQVQCQLQQPSQIQSVPVNSTPLEAETDHSRPKRRLFKLKRSRRSVVIDLQPQDTNNTRKDDPVAAQDDYDSSCPGPSPWLGETSTAEWIAYGNCALWAASAIGSTAGSEANSGGLLSIGNGATGHSQSMPWSRGRGVSSLFRGIGTRLVSILSPRNDNINGNNNNSNQEDVGIIAGTAAVAADNECGIDRILARFGLSAAEMDMLCLALTPTLKSFVVMQVDLLNFAESKKVTPSVSPFSEGGVVDVVKDDALVLELGKEEANMRLAVVLIVMAVYGSLASLAAALSVLPAEAVFEHSSE